MADRRPAGITPAQRGTIVSLFSQGFSLRKCADAADVNIMTICLHRDENRDGLGDELAAAGEAFNDRLRDEIVERAFDRSFRGSDLWLERLAQWRLEEFKLARQEQEEARADQLADALDRFERLFAARTVPAALTEGPAEVVVEPDGG